MKYIVFIVFFVANSFCIAQEVMIDVKADKDTIYSIKGPNTKKYTHMYMGFGFAASGVDGDSLTINYGKSNELIFGLRHKIRVNNFYSFGADLFYSFRNTNIAQTNDKKFATGLNHRKERYSEKNVGAIIYNRFNFGKRGNKIGKFIDLGAYAEVPINNALITTDRINTTNFDQIKVVRKSINFYNSYNYGINFRSGINQAVLFANYRLSNQFKSKYNFAELPRLTIGIQIGLHQ